jgi:hypothetical protein
MNVHATRRATTLLGLGLLAISACASRPTETDERSGSAQPPTETVAVPVAQADGTPTSEESLLTRSLHDVAMSEVVLDAHGEAALTIDTEGGVRLWTSLRATEAVAPLALPVQEPIWMSLARTQDGGFVVGFIDTAGGARVARVEVTGDQARMVSLFEIPITDPQLELHVLDGGQRVLALGLDHRVQLYDRSGELVGAVDQAGFVPWQLRVSEPPDRPAAIVAVLAGPPRVQSITLQGDQLELAGKARPVALDQGPNRNDLSLSPDGSTVAALRRPRAKGTRFTIELVDLATNKRRMLAGDLDGRMRPRLHWVGDERVLLESGTGQAFWFEVSAAVPWTSGVDREAIEALLPVASRAVALPHSLQSERMHATVVAGVRVVPSAHVLVIDPLDQAGHVELGAAPVRPSAVALDGTGTRVAWSTGTGILLDETDGGGMVRELPALAATVVDLAFVGDGELLALGADGGASLLRCGDGQTIATTRMPVSWGLAASSFRRDGAGKGSLAVLSTRPQEPLQVIDVSGTGFGEGRQLPQADRVAWSELGVRTRDIGGVLGQLGFDAVPAAKIDAVALARDGRAWLATEGPQPVLYRVQEGTATATPLRQGRVRRLVLDPTGERLAVVHAASERFAVSVLDADTNERVWTRPAIGFQDLDWSADGARLAVGDEGGGVVLDASTGEPVYARRHAGLRATEVAETVPGDGA